MSETNPKFLSERQAEEYKRQQALFSAQPAIVQRFLETQGKQIAQAIVDGDSQINFSLPDRVVCTLENVDQPALVTILQNQRTRSAGSFLNRFRKVELYKELRHIFTELEQSPDRAVSVAAGLLRHATVLHMVYQMLPAGRTVTYQPAGEDETIPSIPVADEMEPESAITSASDAIAEEGKTEEGRGDLLVPFVPYRAQVFPAAVGGLRSERGECWSSLWMRRMRMSSRCSDLWKCCSWLWRWLPIFQRTKNMPRNAMACWGS
ncbi:MAG: hypothetical protein V9G23_10780 [Giesbergeria sp.]